VKEFTSRRPEFMDVSWPAEFQPHQHPHFADDKLSPNLHISTVLAREGGTGQGLSELTILLHEGTGLISEMKTVLALVKDEEDHRFAQFNK
jgi:hypothetical protein